MGSKQVFGFLVIKEQVLINVINCGSFTNSQFFNLKTFFFSPYVHSYVKFPLIFKLRIFYYKLESYPLREYILGLGAPGTNAVGASGGINGMKR